LTLLAPLALAGLSAIPVIYLIHLLRGTRRRERVPATFLWTGLSFSPGGHARRRWPPLTLLLGLQMAAAALAALALARPALPSPPTRHVAVVLDASASMQATDVSPTRFEAARSQVLQRLASLSAGDKVSLVRAGRTADVVMTGTPDQARVAVASVEPGASASSMHDALSLASAELIASPTATKQIVVFTDGAWPPPPALGELAAPVQLVAVGGGDNNQAIIGLQVRTEPAADRRVAYVEIANYANRPVVVPLRTLGDDAVLDERQAPLPPQGRLGVTLPIPADVHRVTARLLSRDALALDDYAEVVVPAARLSDVRLISPTPSTLARVLSALPFVRVAPADGSASSSPGAQLVVIQGALPESLPPGGLLLVNSTPASALFRSTAAPPRTEHQVGAADLAHPLLQGIDLTAFRPESSFPALLPAWARLVLAGTDGPLIFEGKIGLQPTVVFAFDPDSSHLDKSIALPLLVSNALQYLQAQQGDLALHPGERFTVTARGNTPLVRADGSSVPSRAIPAGDLVQIEAPDAPGRYALIDAENGATLRGFSVSVLDARASDIRPRPLPSLSQVDTGQAAATSGAPTELWPFLAGSLLVVLLAEWLVFARRG
jgi:hypothetical protein